MSMWVHFIHVLVGVALYIAAMLWAEGFFVKRLGARSGLFGAGLVTMFVGVIWCKQLENSFLVDGYWDNGDGTLPLLYYILYYTFLLMGPAGISMMAADLLKAVKELREKLDDAKQKLQAVPGKKQEYEKVPAWKQVVEEQELHK